MEKGRGGREGGGTKNGKVAKAIAFLSLRLEGRRERERERERHGFAMNEENSQRR